MNLTILGCNGPYPTPTGGCSGYYVTCGNTRLCLDLGTGSLATLSALTAPETLTALVFSHWHYDHCSDVLPLLYRLADAGNAGLPPLVVYGPEDETSPIRRILADFPMVRLHSLRCGDTVALGEVTLTAGVARHPVPAISLKVQSEGKTLVYTGDTNLTEGLTDFWQDADLLLGDGLFPAESWSAQKPHLSAALLAELAAKASVKQLLITHLSPNFPAQTLLTEARVHFLRARLAEKGMTVTL